jgi:hypothetical protein
MVVLVGLVGLVVPVVRFVPVVRLVRLVRLVLVVLVVRLVPVVRLVRRANTGPESRSHASSSGCSITSAPRQYAAASFPKPGRATTSTRS